MIQHPKPATRIFGVVARAASRVVLIRRGPTNHVHLVTWDTVKHEFHAGQWLKGRIYEQRCDLSPSGQKFIYLAANHKPIGLGTWTAVSRPPYLTALVLWDNRGTWGGGGLFETERTIALNRKSGVQPEKGFTLPADIRAVPIAPWAGHGEDEPINAMRMKRDDWTLADEGEISDYQREGTHRFEFLRPERWLKNYGDLMLERRTFGMLARNGPNYTREHRLLDRAGNVVLDLGRGDWADWSRSGELLFAREGRVYRVPIDRKGKAGGIDELIDLRSLRFEEVRPPPAALTWDRRVTGRRIT